MKKIISTVLALCLLIALCVPLNALGVTYEEYIAAKKAQASSFSVSIIFHKFYGGIELEFRPYWKIGNSWESFYSQLEDVYYTLDGANPKNGTLFKSNPKLTEAKKYRIRAIALDDEYGWSLESDTTYTVEQLTAPNITTVSEDGVTYVNISSNENAEIYYTTDDSTPTSLSKRYTSEIALTDDTRIKTIAAKTGYVTSNISQSQVAVAKNIKFTCSVCGIKLSAENIFYDDKNNILCEECYYEAKNTKEICSICGKTFDVEDLFFDSEDNPLCQDCYNELPKNEQECYICGEYFNPDDMLYDENDNLICQDCYDELQNDDNNEEIKLITSDWAEDEVYEAYQNNLIPDEMLDNVLYNTITREEFAAIAIKLYENMTGEVPYANINNMPFTDCNTDSEYISYIAVAYKLGITNGTTQTTFSPYDNISREQLTAMLYRVIKLVENNKTLDFDVNNVRKFFDDSDISDYAKESVYFMAEYGIVKGVDSAHFAPLNTATKEQSLVIAVRCVNNLK